MHNNSYDKYASINEWMNNCYHYKAGRISKVSN